MTAVDEHAPALGIAPVCRALGVARAGCDRWKYPRLGPHRPRPRALAPDERRRVLDALRGNRFADEAPAEVVAPLLDEGTYPLGRAHHVSRARRRGRGARAARAGCAPRATPGPSCSRRSRTIGRGAFAGGRFVVRGDEAELALYGSGVPVAASERGELVAR
jgi:hypothetical protein